uniref:Uncharacterized protein n=1 Tax=Anguilla anguilla TaxID=7936 RepID=A0A0E9VZB1_ANGAN
MSSKRSLLCILRFSISSLSAVVKSEETGEDKDRTVHGDITVIIIIVVIIIIN